MATQPVETTEPPVIIENDNQARDFDAEARRQGWKPPEEFAEGEEPPKGGFKTAQEFVEKADEWGVTKDRKIHRLEDEVGFLKRQNKRLMNSEHDRYQDALAQARAEMREAVQIGDTEAYDRAEKKAEKLQEKTGQDFMQGEDPNVELARFRRDNRWFDRGQLPSASREEADAVALFSSISAQYVAQGLDRQLAPSDFFAKIRQEVEDEIPSLFDGSPRVARSKPASDVAPVTNRAAQKRAKTGANLPADAKATAERYMRMGVFDVKTKEEAWNEMAKNWKGDWA